MQSVMLKKRSVGTHPKTCHF